MSPDKKSDLNMQFNFEWLLGFTDNKGKKLIQEEIYVIEKEKQEKSKFKMIKWKRLKGMKRQNRKKG